VLLPAKGPSESSLYPDIPVRLRNTLGEIRAEAKIPALQPGVFKTEEEGENSVRGHDAWNNLHRDGLVAKCSDLSDEIWIFWQDKMKKNESRH
jgi:hypothetical protein